MCEQRRWLPAAVLQMAPVSVSSSFLSSTAGSAEPPGNGKPGLSSSRVMAARRHPTVLRMVLEALQAGEQRRGTSVAAIKLYILHKYPSVDVTRFKYLLKQALATGMRRGLLARPLNSKARGATGSFKLVSKCQRKPQRSRKPAQTGPTGSSKKRDAEPSGPRAPPKPAKALETAPQGGCRAKGTGPQRGVARKDPPKPAGAPSTVHRFGGKPKVPGSRGRQGDAGAPGKTAATAPKAGKRAASPTGRKPAIKSAPGPRPKPKATAATKATAAPKAPAAPKAITAPKAGGPRTGTVSPVRKAGGPGRPRPLVKGSSSSSSEPRS
ncbi:PREDICTED: histone H1oo [Chinchilla lanigera]|uniref:histone H1oo n=1 Tax=Chinchilla lanigera TaxID=34839 RepID=UPI000697BBE5|nr:PREDICTED: histone H1oo [Chinchilla lanigera]